MNKFKYMRQSFAVILIVSVMRLNGEQSGCSFSPDLCLHFQHLLGFIFSLCSGLFLFGSFFRCIYVPLHDFPFIAEPR